MHYPTPADILDMYNIICNICIIVSQGRISSTTDSISQGRVSKYL